MTDESWQSMDDPAISRRAEWSSPCGSWATEMSSTLYEQQWFDSDRNRVVRVVLDPANVRASWPAAGPRTEFDPTVPFAEAVRRGEAQVVGETLYEGVPVTHISWPEDPASDPDGSARNSLYVRTSTGAPVVYFWGGGRRDATGGVVAQQRFQTYEFLPEGGGASDQLPVAASHPTAVVSPIMTRRAFDAEFQTAQRLHCGGGG